MFLVSFFGKHGYVDSIDCLVVVYAARDYLLSLQRKQVIIKACLVWQGTYHGIPSLGRKNMPSSLAPLDLEKFIELENSALAAEISLVQGQRLMLRIFHKV